MFTATQIVVVNLLLYKNFLSKPFFAVGNTLMHRFFMDGRNYPFAFCN